MIYVHSQQYITISGANGKSSTFTIKQQSDTHRLYGPLWYSRRQLAVSSDNNTHKTQSIRTLQAYWTQPHLTTNDIIYTNDFSQHLFP